MARIPVRFERVAAAFNEAARLRLCESSSGSDHSSPDDQDSADLSDLVNSFMEREYRNQREKERKGHINAENDHGSKAEESACNWSPSETKGMLQNLLNNNEDDGNGGEDEVKQRILAETEIARGIIRERSSSSQSFKRGLMTHLREKGFDAGLCKSRWEKFGRHPSGVYEYVDVTAAGKRYIVEVFLAGEFEIARPTSHYEELLDVFPQVFIGRPEDLKQIVKIMSHAIRESMKCIGMHVPPWRRNGYMQAKWFGHYKRTTNDIPARRSQSDANALAAKGAIGFEAMPVRVHNCRDDFASKLGLKVGYLSAAFSGSGIDL